MKRWRITLAGFISVYLVWLIPSYIFQWNEWGSWTYLIADHLALPLFNAIAFNVFVGMKRKTSLKVLFTGLILFVLFGFLLALFEPGAVRMRAGDQLRGVEIYHSVFVFIELSFVLTVFFSYLWIGRSRFNCIALFILFPLIILFLGLVFFVDHRDSFPFWEKAATIAMLFIIFTINLLRQIRFPPHNT